MNRLVLLVSTILSSVYLGALQSHAESGDASFRHAQPGYEWSFPKDHSFHEGFQTEWWYYTGHLWAEGGEPFRDAPLYGFQLTFFRRQGDPSNRTSTEFLAHAALTDLRSGETKFSTRKGGALLGVAGASPHTLEVWSGDWLAELIGSTLVLRFSPGSKVHQEVRLVGAVKSAPWLQGERGFSKKGACDTCASHYYSVARIPLSGEVRRDDGVVAVTGLGWMDHEFMSNSLAPDQVGWDWMGLILKDGRSLTLFRLRRQDGSSSFVSGNILTAEKAERIDGDQIKLTPTNYWTSSDSKGRYPLSWRVEIPSQGIDFVINARTQRCEIGDADSELEPRYWEGPVASTDESVIGYLEMTGYVGKVTL